MSLGGPERAAELLRLQRVEVLGEPGDRADRVWILSRRSNGGVSERRDPTDRTRTSPSLSARSDLIAPIHDHSSGRMRPGDNEADFARTASRHGTCFQPLARRSNMNRWVGGSRW